MFSPCMLGMLARRRSTRSPAEVSKEVRPSCGSRRSAMSMVPMIFSRLMMPGSHAQRVLAQLVQHAVDAAAHSAARLRLGSMWMSLAFMLVASEISASTVAITDSSRARARSASGAVPLAVVVSASACRACSGRWSRPRRSRSPCTSPARTRLPVRRADLVDRDHVERVGHGEHQTALFVDAQGQDAVPHDEVAGQQADGGSRRRLHRAGRLRRCSSGRRAPGQLHLGQQTLAHEDRAQAAAVLPLLRDAAVELRAGRWRRRAAAGCRSAGGPAGLACWRARAPSMRARRSAGSNGLATTSAAPRRWPVSKSKAADRIGEQHGHRPRQLGGRGDLMHHLHDVQSRAAGSRRAARPGAAP